MSLHSRLHDSSISSGKYSRKEHFVTRIPAPNNLPLNNMPTVHSIISRDQPRAKLSWNNANASTDGSLIIPALAEPRWQATTHNGGNDTASHAATTLFTRQSNNHSKRKIAVAGPLIQLTNENRDQIAKLPVAFGFSIPTDDDCNDENNFRTSKQSAIAATKEWYDRGKHATLEEEMRECGLDDESDRDEHDDDADNMIYNKVTSEKLTLLTKIWHSNKHAPGNKMNNKEDASAKPIKQTKRKVATAGPLIELTDSNRDQIAKLPVAFGFSIPSFGFSIPSDEACDKNDCRTSKQAALAATKEWYRRGKVASEVRECGIEVDPDKHIVSDEMDDSCTSEKLTLLAARSSKVRRSNSLSSPATECDKGKCSATIEKDADAPKPAATNDNDNHILRLEGPAILALHEGFEAYLVSIFSKSKLAEWRRAQESENTKKRKAQAQPGKENDSNKMESSSSKLGKENGSKKKKNSSLKKESPSPKPGKKKKKNSSIKKELPAPHNNTLTQSSRPVAMLVETSDCPPGLPPGWTSETYQRASGKTAARADTYWFSPQLKLKFRSKINIQRFLDILHDLNGDESAAWNVFTKRHAS